MEARKKKKIGLKSPHSFRNIKTMKCDTWSTLVQSVMVESQVRHAKSFDSMIQKYEKKAALCKSDVLDIHSYKVVIDHGSLQNTPVRNFGSYAKKFSPQPKKEKKMLRDLFFLMQKSCDPKELKRMWRSDGDSFHETQSELSNDSSLTAYSKLEDCSSAPGSDLEEKNESNDKTTRSETISIQQNLKTSQEKKMPNKESDLKWTTLSNGARLTRQSSKALQQKKTVAEKSELNWSTLSNGDRLTQQSFKAAQQTKISSPEGNSTSKATSCQDQDRDAKHISNELSTTYFISKSKSPVVLIKKLAPVMLKNLQGDKLSLTTSVTHTLHRTLRRSKRLSVQNSTSKCSSQNIMYTKSQNFILCETTVAGADTSLDVCNNSNNRIAVIGASVSGFEQSESDAHISTGKANKLRDIKKSPQNKANIVKQDVMPVVDSNAAESIDFEAKSSIQNAVTANVLLPGESSVKCIKMNSTFTFAERKSVDDGGEISHSKQILSIVHNSVDNDNHSSTELCQSECIDNVNKELQCKDESNAKENVSASASMSVNQILNNESLCIGQNKVPPSETGILSTSENLNNCDDYNRNDITSKMKSFQSVASENNQVSPVNNLNEDLSLSNVDPSICSNLQFISNPMAMSTPMCKCNSEEYTARMRDKCCSEDSPVQLETTCPKLTRNKFLSMHNNQSTRDDAINFITFCHDVDSNERSGNCSLPSESDTFSINNCNAASNQTREQDNSGYIQNLPLPENSVLRSDLGIICDKTSKIPVKHKKRLVVNSKKKPDLSKNELYCKKFSSNANITTKMNINSTQNGEAKSVTVCGDIKENYSNLNSRDSVKASCSYPSTRDDEINFIPLCDTAKLSETNSDYSLLCKDNATLNSSCKILCVDKDNASVSPCQNQLSKPGGAFHTSTESAARHRKRTSENIHYRNFVSRPIVKKLFSSETDLEICPSEDEYILKTVPEKCNPKVFGIRHVNASRSPYNNKNITTQLSNRNSVLFCEPVSIDDNDYSPHGANECWKFSDLIKRSHLVTHKYCVTEDVVNSVTSYDSMGITKINDHSSDDDTDSVSSYNVTPSKIGRKSDLVCVRAPQKSSSEVCHGSVDSVKPHLYVSSSTIMSKRHDFKTVRCQSVDINRLHHDNTCINLQVGVNSALQDELDSSALELRHNKTTVNCVDSEQVNSDFTHKHVNTLGDEINFIPIPDNAAVASERYDHSQLFSVDNLTSVTNGKISDTLKNNNKSGFQCKDDSVLNENPSYTGSYAFCNVLKNSPVKNRKKTTANYEPVEHKSTLSNNKLNSGISVLTHMYKTSPEKLYGKTQSSQHMNGSIHLGSGTDNHVTELEEINLTQIGEPLNSCFNHTLIGSTEDDREWKSMSFLKNFTKDAIHDRCYKTMPQLVSSVSCRSSSRTKTQKSKLWSKRNDCEGASSKRFSCHSKNFSTEADEINFIPLLSP